MIRNLAAIATVAASLAAGSVQAAEKTVILNIKNADCVICPPIVKISLTRVAGVKTVEIKQADQMAPFMATVTFDDAITNVSAIVDAPTKAGYPAEAVN
jgi:mercuric ion binding protein